MANKQMGIDFSSHTAGRGVGTAIKSVNKMSAEAREALDHYYTLNSPVARANYSRHLIEVLSYYMDDAWPIIYEVLDTVKTKELYKLPDAHSKTTFKDFDDFFTQTCKKPFETWAELESTYHFVAENDPSFFEKTLKKAKAFFVSNNPVGRPQKVERNQQIKEDVDSGMTQQEVADKYEISHQAVSKIATKLGKLPNFVANNKTQDSVAKENGISLRTQKKSDYLAKNAPDLFDQTQLPKDDPNRLSIHGAYKKARGLQDPIQVMPDPEKIAAKLKQRLTKDQITKLIALLKEQQ